MFRDDNTNMAGMQGLNYLLFFIWPTDKFPVKVSCPSLNSLVLKLLSPKLLKNAIVQRMIDI